MKVLILTSLLVVASCGMSTEKGSYSGVLIDVSYSGLFMKSCELQFKTSDQSSTSEKASMKNTEKQCVELEASVGKKTKVSYANSLWNPSIDSTYIIKELVIEN
jgi:hypothetical protein